jgi:hypothetical protein
MSWLRAQERTRSLLEHSKKNTGWPMREPDNKFKESNEQLEKSDSEFMIPKVQLKHRIQQNVSKP